MCEPENENREIKLNHPHQEESKEDNSFEKYIKEDGTIEKDFYYLVQSVIDDLTEKNPEKIREDLIEGIVFTHKVNKNEKIPTFLQELKPVYVGQGIYSQGEPY